MKDVENCLVVVKQNLAYMTKKSTIYQNETSL